jgi:FemAB-related protein (PEP-CTERM system-associated)
MRVASVQGDQPGWDLFVESCHDATSHHRYGWKAVFEKSFGHACHYLAAIDDNGVWQGILPLVHMRSRVFGNFLISLPYLNYGGLLCKSEAAAAALLEEAEKLRRNCGAAHVELRHVARRSATLPTRQHKVTMILGLSESGDDQWKAFDPKLRNQIRKAQKSGLQFRRGRLELLDGFYEVFARNMRDLGTPVYSKQLFRNMLEIFPDTTAIAAVLHEEKIIAAGIVSWFRDTVEVPSASSIRDYKAMCPNHMLYWETIRFAIDQGFRQFDFGRSTPGEGTFNFKKQWGALPVPLHWQYLLDEPGHLPELNADNPKYQLAIRVWQRLPVSLTKLLGPRIVRNIP